MIKIKPTLPCKMPNEKCALQVLVLSATLKKAHQVSNTEELTEILIQEMRDRHKDLRVSRVALRSFNILPGIGHNEGKGDEWAHIEKQILSADIVLFTTPIWWGQHSSLMQRVMERMDSIDEDYLRTGKSRLYNKVAGIVITGAEDGASAMMGRLLYTLCWMGFTIPPEAGVYWTGEVGKETENVRKYIHRNPGVDMMSKNAARNLIYYAQLLNKEPLTPVKER